jgi:ribosomal protein S21
MASVKAREGEDITSLITRFHKKVEDERIIKEYRSKQYYIKPSAVKREANKQALRKQYIKNIRATRAQAKNDK